MIKQSYQDLSVFFVLIHFVNIVSAFQVVNMVKFNLPFLLLTVSTFNNVLCKNNLYSFKAMTKIPSGQSIMESIAQKADGTTLCQKHSEIYVNASSNPKGWAFFMAMVPQFMNYQIPLIPQMTAMIIIIVQYLESVIGNIYYRQRLALITYLRRTQDAGPSASSVRSRISSSRISRPGIPEPFSRFPVPLSRDFRPLGSSRDVVLREIAKPLLAI